MILEDIGANRVSVKQNSAGLWRGEITIVCLSIMDGIAVMDRAIDELNKILEKKNNDSKDKS